MRSAIADGGAPDAVRAQPSRGIAGDLVAVFIDLENLALGAGEDLPGRPIRSRTRRSSC